MVYATNHSSPNTDLRIIYFDDPDSPVEIGRYELGTDIGFVHDINVSQHDDRLVVFLSYWDAGSLIFRRNRPRSALCAWQCHVARHCGP